MKMLSLGLLPHKRPERVDAQLNLIPLIDILSVMVAFLLVYSTEVEVLQNPQGVAIPESRTDARPKQSVVVTVTKTDLFVQGEFITTVADIRADKNPLIEPLRTALKRPLLVGQEMSESGVRRGHQRQRCRHPRPLSRRQGAEGDALSRLQAGSGHGEAHHRGRRHGAAERPLLLARRQASCCPSAAPTSASAARSATACS